MTPHVGFRRLLRYARWFTRRDLFEPSARWVTLAVIAATTAFTFAATLALTLPWVTTEIRLRRLSANPWVCCVWVWSTNSQYQELDDERLTQLRTAIRERTGGDDEGLVICGFHHVKYWFRVEGGNREYVGRTVAANDPLGPAISLLLQNGDEGFDGPEGTGIILSPAMAERLGTRTGGEVQLFDDTTGRPWNVKVVGIARDALPLGHEFLLTEAEDLRLRVPAEKVSVVWSGPMGTRSPASWGRFPKEMVSKFQKMGIAGEVGTFGNEPHPVLILTSKNPIPAETWRTHLLTISREMRWLETAPDFATVRVEGAKGSASTVPAAPRGSYLRATIYVHPLKLGQLRPAAEASRRMDLYANDAARLLVDEIETTAERAKATVIALVAAFCVAGFVAITLALYLRGAQQAAQVGMLRAIGATEATLFWIIVVEATVMWLIGTVFGLILACIGGALLTRHYHVTWPELQAAAASGSWAWFVLGYLGLSLLGCLGGNWIATRPFRHRPAAECSV